jgi:gamma-glutamyl-gamma-aminobutyraldehyde dehydrogenase
VAEIGLEAGLPPGVLNVVVGNGRQSAEALGRHRDVDTLTFTGSTQVGRSFLHYSAESNLKRVWLELGGKSPSIVLADADLDTAISETAANIFFNQGEMCSAPSRLLVHRSIHDEVVDGVVAAAERLRIGDPLDPATELGPLVTGAHRDQVEAHIRRGIDDGARLRTGGSRPEGVDPGGFFLRPAVLDDVQPQMAIARDEVFGPVLSVLVFDDEDEAVQLANDSEYGLAAAVWTRDVSTVHRMSRRLQAGTVWVNCYEEADVTVPFGGYGQSGNGRDKSAHALNEYTELKTTWLKL